MEMGWDKQIGEPALWYTRFTQYLMQKGRRSVLVIYNEDRKRRNKEPAGAIPSAWFGQTKRWDWTGRAARYDEEQAKQVRETTEAFRREHLKQEMEMSTALFAKAKKMIEQSLFKTTRTEDGMTEIKPVNWSQTDAAVMASTASRLGRLAASMDKEESSSEKKTEHPSAVIDWLKDISDDLGPEKMP